MQSKRSETNGKPNRKKRSRKRLEFSKVIAVIAICMWLFVNLFGMAMVIFTLDTSPLMYVIPSVDAVVAVVCAYYFWKAKAENQIKLKKIYGADADCVTNESGYYTLAIGGDDYPTAGDAPLYENSNLV